MFRLLPQNFWFELQCYHKYGSTTVTHSRDKSLFLPLDTNEIGVKYEQREVPGTVFIL